MLSKKLTKKLISMKQMSNNRLYICSLELNEDANIIFPILNNV